MTNERKYKKCLKELTTNVMQFEVIIDTIMKHPASPERGEKIANALNGLTIANQSALRFGLGYGFRKIENLYKR